MNSETSKPKIMIVDDEASILDSLRRMLRHKRHDWDIDYVLGGGAALDRLNAGPIDLVISDMQMPGVNGALVLESAAKQYPECVRIVLSGHAETTSLLRAMSYAHRFMAKPCEPNAITNAIERALALRAVLPNTALRALVGSLKTVPVPSDRYFQLMQEFDSPVASAKSISERLESDIGLSTQIMRLANSAYFGLQRRITRCREGVEMLGLETIRALVMLSEFYLNKSVEPEMDAESRGLAERSLKISENARRIAQKYNLTKEQQDDAATAGLLCHIGTSLLALDQPTKYQRAIAMTEHDHVPFVASERKIFGANHAELGAYLVGLWGFPDSVVEAIAFHHTPSTCNHIEVGSLTAVHLAQALTGDTDTKSADTALFHNNTRQPQFDDEYLNALGIARERQG